MTSNMVAGGIVEAVTDLVAFEPVGPRRAPIVTVRSMISWQTGALPRHVITFRTILAPAFVYTVLSVRP